MKVVFQLVIDVHDIDCLHMEAVRVATEGIAAMGQHEAMHEMKPHGVVDVAACVQMILHRDLSIDWGYILDCTVEVDE